MFAIFRIVPLLIMAAIVAIVVALVRGRRGKMNSEQQDANRTYASTMRSNYHGPVDDPIEVPIIEVNDIKED